MKQHTPTYKWVAGPIVIHTGRSVIELSDEGESIFLQMRDSHRLIANARLIVTAVNAHDALVKACTRMLNLSSHCDYEGPEDAKPEDCPGIVENGFWCHWCQMRAALALVGGDA